MATLDIKYNHDYLSDAFFHLVRKNQSLYTEQNSNTKKPNKARVL